MWAASCLPEHRLPTLMQETGKSYTSAPPLLQKALKAGDLQPWRWRLTSVRQGQKGFSPARSGRLLSELTNIAINIHYLLPCRHSKGQSLSLLLKTKIGASDLIFAIQSPGDPSKPEANTQQGAALGNQFVFVEPESKLRYEESWYLLSSSGPDIFYLNICKWCAEQ